MDPNPGPGLQAPIRIGPAGVQTGSAFEQYSAEIHGFLVRTVRDIEVAADLVADTFTKMLIEERAGRWPDHPRAWLYRVASNLAMSRGRHLQVATRVDRMLQRRGGDNVAESPDIEVLRRERRTDLDQALARLGADARVALLLAAQGYDGATIAMTLGRTEASTRTLMSRSRLLLREQLHEEHR